VATGNFTLTVNGVGFTAGSVVSFDGLALSTTLMSATQLRALGNAPAAKRMVPIVVTTPDGEASAAFYVDVVAPAQPVHITISPTATTVRVSRTTQFSAAVQNSPNTSVIWQVNGITGGSSMAGTITASGTYRAPNSVPKPAIVTVSATSVADPTQTASASVTIVRK
jgi:hypothetical protein